MAMHTHVMVDVPCGYSFLFVNLKGGSGYSLLLSWLMYHVDLCHDMCEYHVDFSL